MAEVNNCFGIEKLQSSYDLLFMLRNNLKEVVNGKRNLRLLDYGAGEHAFYAPLFLTIASDMHYTAYDPDIKQEELEKQLSGRLGQDTERFRATSTIPVGQFDLIVCQFSLHHFDLKPAETIRMLSANYKPRWMAIMEYDYRGVEENEFKETFRTWSELKELQNVFQGDLQKAKDFHSRFGSRDYLDAFLNNGFSVVSFEKGEKEAKNKFYMIGERNN